MLRRIIEIVAGVAIAFCLFISYGDDTHKTRVIIWYLLTPNVLGWIVWFILFFIAARLIFGKYRDYSKYFYSLIVKVFGDPKKVKKTG